MRPSEAIEALIERGKTEQAIADLVGSNQSTIHRIRHGQSPRFDLGQAIVALAAKEARARRKAAA